MDNDANGFKLGFATLFLAAVAGTRYDEWCARDLAGTFAANLPYEDALDIAEDAWEQFQKRVHQPLESE